MAGLTFPVVALLLLGAIFTAPSRAEDGMPQLRKAITGYVIPGFERLARNGESLAEDVQRLCRTPSGETLAGARTAFDNAVDGLGRVYFLRIGPLETMNRRDRLLFWPDRRSIALKQVQRVLVEEDETVKDPARLAGKSVALQGFGALEYLLFGTGSDTLADTPDAFRCLFALAVARNIEAIARQVAHDWRAEDGFARMWSEPGPDNDLYRNAPEALTTLFGLLSSGLEAMRDQQLQPIAPLETETRPYKRALFWRSNQTLPFVTASLTGMRDLIHISGLLDGLPSDQQWIAGSVDFEFSNAFKTLAELSGSIETVVGTPRLAAKLRYLVIVAGSLQNLLGERAVQALNLPTTFSPLDGD